jgi:hypothetical protein
LNEEDKERIREDARGMALRRRELLGEDILCLKREKRDLEKASKAWAEEHSGLGRLGNVRFTEPQKEELYKIYLELQENLSLENLAGKRRVELRPPVPPSYEDQVAICNHMAAPFQPEPDAVHPVKQMSWNRRSMKNCVLRTSEGDAWLFVYAVQSPIYVVLFPISQGDGIGAKHRTALSPTAS